MWRTPSSPRVVVIVPCGVRTVVDLACADGTNANATSTARSTEKVGRTRMRLLNRFRQGCSHAATGSSASRAASVA